MKRLVIALDSSSLQPSPVDDRTACQIVPGPLDSGLLRVSLSLSFCAQECVCARGCAQMFVQNFSPSVIFCVLIFLTMCVPVYSMNCLYVYAAVLSTLGCCDLGYHLSDRQVCGVFREINRHINNKTSCQTGLFSV